MYQQLNQASKSVSVKLGKGLRFQTQYIYLLLCSGMFVSFLAGLGQKSSPMWICFAQIETYNNIARYNLIDTKYSQIAFRSLSDGAQISPYHRSFGTPGQTKVSGDCQRETTHEICCLAAEFNQ